MLPSEETSAEMYVMAQELLNGAGLKQYEISASAKPGYSSCHNTGYWTGQDFLGFGPSAFSYWKGKRFRNVANLSRYHQALLAHQSPIDFEEELEHGAKIRELLVIHLRLIEGCNLETFQKQHGVLDATVMKTIEILKEHGYLIQEDPLLRMTQKGILFYDHLASELI